MTYRNNLAPTPEAFKAFSNYLDKENKSKETKELQPWIPFCEGRCSFCYFPVNCEKHKTATYVEAMKKALQQYAKSRYVQTSEFSELYIGGGSPSILAEKQITDILDFCRSSFNMSGDSVTKFTACTYGLTDKKIRLLASQKVDQLDMGVQTFDGEFREILSLRDGSNDSKQKLETVRKNGLGLSIDLLYNLPGQTVEQWKKDIKQALELEVESVDCYPLDLYANTPLARRIASGELPSAGDYKKELEMYLEAYDIFKENGYFPTCHNRFSRLKEDLEKPSSEVVGTGAGFFMGNLGNFQYSDIEDVNTYIDTVNRGSLPLARLSTLSKEDEMKKAMMLIYVRVPVNRKDFKARFGKFPEDAFPKAIEELRRKGLIVEENGEIKLSEKGDPWRFNIAWEFFK
ncbi:MAG TPA: radical SAM protein [Candidatus Nanoarchaeia archaeon]|nr:radical SAM protein [Candidatus Nanoarchaeia archaeon]